MSEADITVKTAIKMLNDTLHQQGFHIAMVRLDGMDYNDIFGGDGNGDAMHHILSQTGYDWRYNNKPEKDSYTITLSNKDLEYIGRAVELYRSVLVDRYEKEMKMAFRGIFEKLSDIFEEAKEKELEEWP